MKKFILFSLFSLLFGIVSQGQDLEWARKIDGPGQTAGFSINVDNAGNIYTVGEGYGSSTNIFIQKRDALGNILWTKGLYGSYYEQKFIGLGSSVVDEFGNIYITGSFMGSINFDPNSGTHSLSSALFDIFVLKLTASGNYSWARSFVGLGLDGGNDITLDNSYNVYVTGTFEETVDFDPGFGVSNLTATPSNTEDQFIVKLTNGGQFIWSKSTGNEGYDIGKSITTDLNGNVLTTGYFSNKVDFDPNADTTFLTSQGSSDIYVQKLDPNGNFLWVKQIGSSTTEQVESIVSDADGNILHLETLMAL